jgi:PAS domain S-box-containing protein
MPYRWEFHNPTVNRDFGIVDRIIKWPDGRDVRFEIALDITERKRAEEALKFSEERAQRLLEQSFDAVIIHANEHIVFANDIAVKLLGGKTQEDFLGKPILSIVHPEYMDIVKERIKMNLNGLPSPVNEERLIRLDGSPVDVEVTAINDIYQGKPAIRVIFRDISRRKHAEEALRESEKKYRNLVEQVNDWVWEIDANGIYKYAGPQVRKLLGYEPGEIVGTSPFDYMVPEESERVRALFRPIFEAQEAFSLLENILIKKDGSAVTVETSGMPIFDVHGIFIGYRGIDRDITERKRADEALQESEARLRAFLENSEVIGWMKDEDGRYVYMSQNYNRRFNTRSEDWQGKTDFEFWPREIAEQFRKNDLAVLESGRSFELVEEAINPDGSKSWWLSFKFPFRDAVEKGSSVGWQWTSTSVSGLRKS